MRYWRLTIFPLAAVWLWPFAAGPSASVEPLLAGTLMAAVALALVGSAMPVIHVLRTGLGMSLVVVLALAGWALWPSLWLGVLAAGMVVVSGVRVALAGRQGGEPVAHWMALAWLAAGLLSVVFAGLQYTGLTQSLAPWVNQASTGRVFANLRQPNLFATLESLSLAALLYLAGRPRRPSPGWWPVSAAVLLALGNAMSSSRTGLVQILLLCGLAWCWRQAMQPPQWRVLWVAVLAYGVASVLLTWQPPAGGPVGGPVGLTRLANESIDSHRFVLWRNVLQLIGEHPWLGWGWGELDYAHYVTRYDGPRFGPILDNAHNLPLHLAVELGLPMALAFCAAVAWAMVRARPWRETDPARQMAWAVLAVLGLHSLLEYPLWYAPFQLALGLCLGLLWPAKGHAPRANESVGAVVHWPWRLVALGVCVLCALVAWDYRRVSQIYLPPEARAPEYQMNTLDQARGSWFFQDQARFAELTLTPLTPENARWTHRTAKALLHYSPEPRVIEKVIESAVMLGLHDTAQVHMARYRAAFPDAHARWERRSVVPLLPGRP